jgi:hypothetical protein
MEKQASKQAIRFDDRVTVVTGAKACIRAPATTISISDEDFLSLIQAS